MYSVRESMKRPQQKRNKMEKALRRLHGPNPVSRNFDLVFKKYAGSRREEFLASGYKTVDEFINEMRGRNALGELDVPGPFQ